MKSQFLVGQICSYFACAVLAASTGVQAADRLKTEAEYVGPVPKTDLSIFKLAASVRLHSETGRLAYFYSFDDPEMFLERRESMRNARMIIDGVPSEQRKLVSRPFVGNNSVMYIGHDGSAFRIFDNSGPMKATFFGFTPSSLTFSSRSGRLACLVSQDEKSEQEKTYRVLIDDQLGPPADGFRSSEMEFDASGQRFAYAARNGRNWRVYLDGKPGPEHLANFIDHICYSSDGKKLAYIIVLPRDRCRVVVDGEEQPIFVDVLQLQFSPVDDRWACLAFEDEKWHLLVDGKRVVDDVVSPADSHGQLFTSDGKYCVLKEAGGRKWFIHEGIDPIPFDDITKITFSPQGGHVAYVGVEKSEEKSKYFVVRDGKRSRAYDGVYRLQFSPLGNRLACVISDQGSRFVEVDGQRAEAYGNIPTGPNQIAFSDDEEHYAYRAYRDGNEEMFVVVDGKLVGTWQWEKGATLPDSTLPPVFSPDGKHVAFEAIRDGKQIMVVDGRESEPFDRLFPTPIVFESATRVRFIALRDGELFRVYADLEGKKVFDGTAIRAWHALGTKSENGEGTDQDYYTAFAYYRKAAELGHAASQKELGKLYSWGKGVARDDGQSMRWSRLAADQGHPTAQSNVGVLYRDARSVKKDMAEAARWFRKGADGGDSSAQRNLADLYRDGTGVGQDDSEAFKLYKLSAEQGDVTSQAWVGYLLVEGRGTRKDPQEGMAWYRKAIEQGDAYSMNQLAWEYESGKSINKDLEQAKQWYRKAARAGNAKARDNLLRLLTVRPSFPAFDPWFVKTKTFETLFFLGPGGKGMDYRAFYLDVPVLTDGETIKVPVPLNVAVHPSPLPTAAMDACRPPTPEQKVFIEKWYPKGTISICYPPYLVFGLELETQSDEAKMAIQKYLEDLYETSAAKLPFPWGYWDSDGFYYLGHVDRHEGDRYLFRFYDGSTALLAKNQIHQRSPEAGDSVQADWQRRGTYYPATVLSRTGRNVRVRYTSDGTVEDVDVLQLRVKFAAARDAP